MVAVVACQGLKAFRVCVRTAERAKAGPSTALRSGRDDNSFARKRGFPSWIQVNRITKLSSRPERSAVEGPALALSAVLTNTL